MCYMFTDVLLINMCVMCIYMYVLLSSGVFPQSRTCIYSQISQYMHVLMLDPHVQRETLIDVNKVT